MTETKKKFEDLFKRPFTYDDYGAMVFDSQGNRVLDLRAWGYMTGWGSGALAMPQDEAAKLQDDFGNRLVQQLNAGVGIIEKVESIKKAEDDECDPDSYNAGWVDGHNHALSKVVEMLKEVINGKEVSDE